MMRELLARRGIAREVISLRQCMETHEWGTGISLRQALTRYSTPVSSDGYSVGCNWPTQRILGELAYAVPSWVPVSDERDRVVQGIVERSKISGDDFPLSPWHKWYDWNIFVRVDAQYQHLLSASNINDHDGLLECEWDTSEYPAWAWPQEGNRVYIFGRWIYDCGHPGENLHKTEIHPPRAIVIIRRESAHFPGNTGRTRAAVARFYAWNHGGYWDSYGLRDYEFDLYLPPKPTSNALPLVRWNQYYNGTPGMTATLYPGDDPRVVRVRVPQAGGLNGLEVFAGWSDADGSAATRIRHVRVTLKRVHMYADLDVSGDEWYLYVCVNNRWFEWDNIGGWSKNLDTVVDLYLDPADPIVITACGFEADLVHDHMGEASDYSWEEISAASWSIERKEEIEDSVFWQLQDSWGDVNDPIGHLYEVHVSANGRFPEGDFGAFSRSPWNFGLVYNINDSSP